MPEVKQKKTRVSNAQLKKEIAAYDAVVKAMAEETAALTIQVATLQEALLRVVGQWDVQIQQVGGAVQEVVLRINTLTAGIEAEPVEQEN